MSITTSDIDLLIREPSAKRRAGVAEKLTLDYNSGRYSESEKDLAHDIFRLLLKDVETRVRKVIADSLYQNLSVPRDILLRLANDVPEVAVPVLEHSYALSEEDLIEIVRSTKAAIKLQAVARRPSISRALSNALMHTREASVVTTLFQNKCASLDDEEVLVTLEDMRYHNGLLEALVERGGLALPLVEKIILHVSEEMRTELTQHYRLSSRVVNEAVEAGHDWSALTAISSHTPVHEIHALMAQLQATGRLTHSIVLRSLCTGDMRFFEAAMAKLANIPYSNASLLMLDPGARGFRAVYERAGMPGVFLKRCRHCTQSRRKKRNLAVTRVRIIKTHRAAVDP